MQVSEDNGATFVSTGIYSYAWTAVNGSGGTGTSASTASVAINLHTALSSSAVNGLSATLRFHNLGDSTHNKFGLIQSSMFATANGINSATGGFSYGSQNPVNAVRFKFESGNINFGTVKAYGIKVS
jgi:hypothetical protein